MIIHIPTGKRFNNRKEAKIYFGSAYYYKIEKLLTDLPPLVLFNSSKVILTLYQSSLERDKQKNL